MEEEVTAKIIISVILPLLSPPLPPLLPPPPLITPIPLLPLTHPIPPSPTHHHSSTHPPLHQVRTFGSFFLSRRGIHLFLTTLCTQIRTIPQASHRRLHSALMQLPSVPSRHPPCTIISQPLELPRLLLIRAPFLVTLVPVIPSPNPR